MSETLIGFEPRSSVKPMWLHTIELDPDGRLVGAVICIARQYFDAITDLLGLDATDPRRRSMIVHSSPAEMWLRLGRDQSLQLRAKLGKMNESTSPFGARAYEAYSSLAEVENIVYHEEP